MKKKILSIVTAVMMMLGSVSTVSADGNKISVFVNNQPISYGESRVYNGTAYVPVKPVFEKLGYNVSYDGRTKVVTIIKDEEKVNINLAENTLSGKISVDGEIQDVSGFIENSQIVGEDILIPLKSIGSNLGCDVIWNQNSAWVYAKDFNGERMVTETKLDTVDIINDETYLQTLNSMLRSRTYKNLNMDYINLTDGVSPRFRDLHNHYNKFFKLINSKDMPKHTNYANINFDIDAEDWKPLDEASAYLVLLHKDIDRLEAAGLLDTASYYKGQFDNMYKDASNAEE